MKRRTFVATTGCAALSTFSGPSLASGASEIQAGKLPRWRGFNLLEKFTLNRNAPYEEQDFAWAQEWGFDFFRLPMDYRCWTSEDDPRALDEAVLGHIDQAIAWGKSHHIHMNLNLHRAPGYCVNPPKEPLDLWTQQEALDLFCFQWQSFAERYKGIPNTELSFDLLNEPPGNVEEEIYAKVMRAAILAIREVDPERLIVVDGLRWGRQPVTSLADMNIAQSTRGYDPMQMSHYKASWVNSENWTEPEWPMKLGDTVWNREKLREHVEPFVQLEAMGVGVHVGEWGCYNRTPHDVALAWMEDFLTVWQGLGWGWGLWNLRGAFGLVDSGRTDVQYESLNGHQLDRAMLELLKRY